MDNEFSPDHPESSIDDASELKPGDSTFGGLTIYKLTENFKIVQEEAVHKIDTVLGPLYLEAAEDKVPDWLSALSSICQTPLPAITTRRPKAALVVSVGNDRYALTFGDGRWLFELGSFVSSFGLRTLLNAVDSKSLKTLGKRVLDSTIPFARQQAGALAPIDDFGVDVDRDLLRKSSGRPRKDLVRRLGPKIEGDQSLKITAKVRPDAVCDLLKRVGQLYHDTTYQKDFPWVDNIQLVTDQREVNTLNAELDQRLKGPPNKAGLLSLGLPDYGDIEPARFRVARCSNNFYEFNLANLRQALGQEVLTVEYLKRTKLSALSAEGAQLKSWKLYECVHAELDIKNDPHRYVLIEGEWFRLQRDFVQKVRRSAKNIPLASLDLPEYGGNSETKEADYSKLVHQRDPNKFGLMDQKNINHGGGQSKVELCDLLSAGKQLIHFKLQRGSSHMSHLFNQGVVSAQLIKSDPEFRAKANRKIQGSTLQLPEDQLNPAEYEVIFGIITEAKQAHPADYLPIFSLVTLTRAYRTIHLDLGFRVSLKTVNSIVRIVGKSRKRRS